MVRRIPRSRLESICQRWKRECAGKVAVLVDSDPCWDPRVFVTLMWPDPDVCTAYLSHLRLEVWPNRRLRRMWVKDHVELRVWLDAVRALPPLEEMRAYAEVMGVHDR